MSTAEWLTAVALAVATGSAVALVVTRTRLRRVEGRVRSLEARLAREVEPAVAAAREDARAAATTARSAAARVGIAEPPPRVPLEPVAGPVVRAVAIGAGASRALARLARPRARRRSG